MDFVLPLPKLRLTLLSTDQSNKVKKFRFRFPLLSLYPYVRKPEKYHRHIIEVHYLQSVVRR